MQRLMMLTGALALGAMSLACNAKAESAEKDDSAKTEKPYELAVVATPQTVAKDGEASYRITITPKGDYVLKTETPFKVTLSADEALTLAQTSFTAEDFDDPKTPAKSVSTTFKGSAPGDAKIAADMSFFLCNAQLCQRFTAKNELAVTVQ